MSQKYDLDASFDNFLTEEEQELLKQFKKKINNDPGI